MTYASRADLEAIGGADEVAQRESVLPAGAVDRFLAEADAEIDSYVRGRYAVPLNPVPSNIPRLAAVIARYLLLGESATERARDDYKDARGYLLDVQAGRAQLQTAAPLAGGEPANAVMTVSRPRIFNGGLV